MVVRDNGQDGMSGLARIGSGFENGHPCRLFSSNYPPAEPEALRLLAPQRGLIATGESKSKNKSKDLAMQMSITRHSQTEGEHIPVTVKLLLPPRQSRGISLLD